MVASFFVLDSRRDSAKIEPQELLMALGLCCQWIEPKNKRNGSVEYKNIINEKSLQLGSFKKNKYPISRISSTYHNNVDEHLKIVPKLVQNNIRSFRLSSSLFPLYEFNIETIHTDEILCRKLKKLGDQFKQAGIRVTTHPGQFCIINSDAEHVIKNSINELAYHAWVFDQMGLPQTPESAINIHGGKRGNTKKLIDTIHTLPDNIRKRLTLENDERCFSVKQLLQVFKETEIPIVFDSHHHQFNQDGFDSEEACSWSASTWKRDLIEYKPLQHISNTEPGMENGSFPERRKHSNFIHYVPENQLRLARKDLIDLDVEAKMKNLAIFKMRKEFNISV
jgi:UV DNA damage endonuclease